MASSASGCLGSGDTTKPSTQSSGESGTDNKIMRKLLQLILGLLLAMSLFMPFAVPVQAATATIDSDVDSYTPHSFQRNIVYASGRYWAFYSDKTNIVVKSSTDGEIWSSATNITTGTRTQSFSVTLDSDGALHYVKGSHSINVALYYRKGTLNADGSITWAAVEQEVAAAAADVVYRFPTIAIDSGGYPWIGVEREIASVLHAYVYQSSTKDGTWTTAAGFPADCYSACGAKTTVLPMNGGKMYVLYGGNGTDLKGKQWNGAGWEAQDTLTTSMAGEYRYSGVSNGDTIDVLFLSNLIVYHKHYNGSSWGSSATVQNVGSNLYSPTIARTDNVLYAFWGSSDNHIYYKLYDGESWEGSATNFKDETTDTLVAAGTIQVTIRETNKLLGVAWRTKTGGVGNDKLKFDTLQTVVAPTLSTLSATNVHMDGGTHATLRGSLDSLGGAPSCDIWFEWGYDTGYGNTVGLQTGILVTGTYTYNLTGYNPTQTVHYRFVGENVDGTTYGSDMPFELGTEAIPFEIAYIIIPTIIGLGAAVIVIGSVLKGNFQTALMIGLTAVFTIILILAMTRAIW